MLRPTTTATTPVQARRITRAAFQPRGLALAVQYAALLMIRMGGVSATDCDFGAEDGVGCGGEYDAKCSYTTMKGYFCRSCNDCHTLDDQICRRNLCAQCPRGQYKYSSDADANGRQSGCTQCGVGTWSGVGAGSCSNVGAGSQGQASSTFDASLISPISGAGYAVVCPGGKYSTNGNGLCADVGNGKQGQTTNDVGGDYASSTAGFEVNCPGGKFNTDGTGECEDCAPGKYHTTPLGRAVACELDIDAGKQGQASSKDFLESRHVAEGAVYAVDCGDGFYNTAGAQEQCTDVGNGMQGQTSEIVGGDHASAGAIYQVECPIGKSNTDGTGECEDCAAGFYQDSEGQTECKRCLAEDVSHLYYYNDSSLQRAVTENGTGAFAQTGATNCSVCDLGKYDEDLESSTICTNHTKCDPGNYTSVVGNNTENPVCEECVAGTFKANVSNSSTVTDEDACLTCADGSWSAAGAAICTVCEPGHYTFNATTPCIPCDTPGYVTDTLANDHGTTCTTCAPGWYTMNSTVACQHCPRNSVTDTLASPAARNCTECVGGTFTMQSTTECIAPFVFFKSPSLPSTISAEAKRAVKEFQAALALVELGGVTLDPVTISNAATPGDVTDAVNAIKKQSANSVPSVAAMNVATKLASQVLQLGRDGADAADGNPLSTEAAEAAAQAAAVPPAAAEAAAAAATATAAAAVAAAAAVDTNADAVAAVEAAVEAAAEATTGAEAGTAAAAAAVKERARETTQAAGSAEDVRGQVQALTLAQDAKGISGTQTNPVTTDDGVQESKKEVLFPAADGVPEQRVTVVTKTDPKVVATAVDKTGSSVLTETDATTETMRVQSDASGTMVDVVTKTRLSTATERDAAGNAIGSSSTKIEEQTMVIPVKISDGVTVDVVTKTRLSTATERDAAGKTIGSIVTETESNARVVPVVIDGVPFTVETETKTAVATVKDNTGAVTGSTETETEKQTTVVPVKLSDGATVNAETETRTDIATVKDAGGAVTGSTETETKKLFMVVTGTDAAGVAVPVEIRREAATVTERDAAGNAIGSSSTKTETQTTVATAKNDAGVPVPVEIRRETETKTVTDASGFETTTTTATATATSQPERVTLMPGGGTRAVVVAEGTKTVKEGDGPLRTIAITIETATETAGDVVTVTEATTETETVDGVETVTKSYTKTAYDADGNVKAVIAVDVDAGAITTAMDAGLLDFSIAAVQGFAAGMLAAGDDKPTALQVTLEWSIQENRIDSASVDTFGYPQSLADGTFPGQGQAQDSMAKALDQYFRAPTIRDARAALTELKAKIPRTDGYTDDLADWIITWLDMLDLLAQLRYALGTHCVDSACQLPGGYRATSSALARLDLEPLGNDEAALPPAPPAAPLPSTPEPAAAHDVIHQPPGLEPPAPPAPPAQPPTLAPEPTGAHSAHGEPEPAAAQVESQPPAKATVVDPSRKHGKKRKEAKPQAKAGTMAAQRSKKLKKAGTKSKKAGTKPKKASSKSKKATGKKAHAKTFQRLSSGKADSTSADHSTAALLVTAAVAVLIVSGAMIGLVAALRTTTVSKEALKRGEVTPLFEASAPVLL